MHILQKIIATKIYGYHLDMESLQVTTTLSTTQIQDRPTLQRTVFFVFTLLNRIINKFVSSFNVLIWRTRLIVQMIHYNSPSLHRVLMAMSFLIVERGTKLAYNKEKSFPTFLNQISVVSLVNDCLILIHFMCPMYVFGFSFC